MLDNEVYATSLLRFPLAVCQAGLPSTLKASDKVALRLFEFETLTSKGSLAVVTVVGTLAEIDVAEFTVTVGEAYSVPSFPINLTVAPD